MKANFKPFALVMAANFEAVVIMIMAHHAGIWFEEKFPNQFGGAKLFYLIAIVVIGVLWIKMFRELIKETLSGKSSGRSEESTDQNQSNS